MIPNLSLDESLLVQPNSILFLQNTSWLSCNTESIKHADVFISTWLNQQKSTKLKLEVAPKETFMTDDDLIKPHELHHKSFDYFRTDAARALPFPVKHRLGHIYVYSCLPVLQHQGGCASIFCIPSQ